MLKKSCSVCHTEMTCGIQQNGESCWCGTLPAIMPAEFLLDCRCQSCLAIAISEYIDASIKANSHEKMLEIASAYRADNSLHKHIDYLVEDNNYVFSKWYHLKRGVCCGNDCRNCPY